MEPGLCPGALQSELGVACWFFLQVSLTVNDPIENLLSKTADFHKRKLHINKSNELYLIELRSNRGSSSTYVLQIVGMCDRDKGGAEILEWLLTSRVQELAQQANGTGLVTR